MDFLRRTSVKFTKSLRGGRRHFGSGRKESVSVLCKSGERQCGKCFISCFIAVCGKELHFLSSQLSFSIVRG